jgi:phenylalanyl-tRNA synthetase beta chain
MLLSHEWLKGYVPHTLTPVAVRDLISAHVATVDGMETLWADLGDIVVARVLEVARHPNADALWLTKVDDGSGTVLEVVCGAPNVKAGRLYPLARTGARLPGNVVIERRKIRGIVSNGMLCSARELGLGEDHTGILELDVTAAPGTPLLEALPLADTRFDVDVLPNRPDLLSHLGMARELAALTGVALRLPPELDDLPEVPAARQGSIEVNGSGVTVRVEDRLGAPRYMGAVIRGVRVGPSPSWLVRRLESVGLRSINNVVDVTNYCVYGLGQPMHAFDLAGLAESTVVVRRARAGERLVTLDGVQRSLDDDVLVIADAQRPVAVAGVLGGKNSEVGPDSADIFLEVALFDPRRVRYARRLLGVSTEASYRFERGVDPALAPRALAVAVGLILKVAGGRLDGAPLEVGSADPVRAAVRVSSARLGRLLGAPLTAGEIGTLIERIGFAVEASGEELLVTPPSWRSDVRRDVDILEEVARLRGYATLADEVRPFRPGTVPDHPLWEAAFRLRATLVGLGLLEAQPLPFVRGSDHTHVRVRNPVAEDEPHLRSSLLETLAKLVEYNYSRMNGDVRLFEIGSVFRPRPDALPVEEMRLAVAISGRRQPPHFTDKMPQIWDAWDVKALAERLLATAFPGKSLRLVPGDGNELWRLEAGTPLAEVGRAVVLDIDRPAWASPAYGIELTLGQLTNEFVAAPGTHLQRVQPLAAMRQHRRYRPLPVTPAAQFDIALLVPDGVTAAQIERVIRQSAGALLEDVLLFDEYRGEGIPPSHRSLAWRLTLRDPERTLREQEIVARRERVLRALEKELGVKARTS